MIGEQMNSGERMTDSERGERDALMEKAYGRMVALVDAAEARGVDVASLRRELINNVGDVSVGYKISMFSTKAEDPALSAALAQEYLNYGLSIGKYGISAIIRFGEDLRRLAKLGDEARASIVEHNPDYANFFDTLEKAETREAVA